MSVVYCADCEIHLTRDEDEFISEVDRRILCHSCNKDEQAKNDQEVEQ